MAFRTACFGALVLGAMACGGQADQEAAEGGADRGDAGFALPDARPRDASLRDTSLPQPDPADTAPTPWDRMTSHAGTVLPSMKLVAVYFGEARHGDAGTPSFDSFLTWLVTSDYWGLMKQYGVGPGSLVTSVRLDASLVFAPGVTPKSTISAEDLDVRIAQLLHPELLNADAGTSDEDAGDGGDAADASDAATSVIPRGDAYVFFMPDGINITASGPNGETWTTCVEIGGYHYFDQYEPYAVLPPCSFGRSAWAISHELAEMATDPVPESGWYSDADVNPAGGEIGDLCNFSVTVEGWSVTSLWSNKDGSCIPAQ